MDVRLVRMVEDFVDELRRNEVHAFAIAYDKVARHNCHLPDAHGHVDSREHDVANGRWVGAPEIRRQIDLG